MLTYDRLSVAATLLRSRFISQLHVLKPGIFLLHEPLIFQSSEISHFLVKLFHVMMVSRHLWTSKMFFYIIKNVLSINDVINEGKNLFWKKCNLNVAGGRRVIVQGSLIYRKVASYRRCLRCLSDPANTFSTFPYPGCPFHAVPAFLFVLQLFPSHVV